VALIGLLCTHVTADWLVNLAQQGVGSVLLGNNRWLISDLEIRLLCSNRLFGRSLHSGTLGALVNIKVARGLLNAHLKVINLGDKTVLLQLHEHLFLKGDLVFLAVVVKFGLELFLGPVFARAVSVELCFFLLDTSVVDFLEITLFTKFIVSGPGFFSDNSCFVELLLEDSELVGQLLVALINLGDLGDL